MLGGKTASKQRPTALGSLIQAATYGMAIPTVYGTTQTSVLAIWAQNLRQGKCHGKKGKGKKKKGPPQYIENIDFLIGSNPIEGCLQLWENATKYPLNFIKYDFTLGLNQRSVTISDAQFYFLIAVTADIHNTGYFNDYGSPFYGAIGSATVHSGGSGYAVNDTFTVNGGTSTASGHVTTVSGGAVTGIALDVAGTGYATGVSIPTTTTSGVGSGLTLNIANLGVAYDDTSEYPLWNIAQQGPDLIDAGYAKYFPWLYKWAVGDGSTFLLPFVQNNLAPTWGLPNGTGNFHAYYAQLSAAIGHQIPLTKGCLTFEPVLGDGPEYSGFTSQQILYPPYAGLGSPDIDLGTSGAIPSVKPETVGSFKRWHPRGDADFPDMIEDTLKSGMLQVGSQLGLIQRGVNLNELPGAVQKVQYWQLEPTPATGPDFIYGFQQPIAKGQVMIMYVRWRLSGGSPPTISDQAGNTWIPILTTDNVGFWYAIAAADIAAGNQVICTFNGGGFAYDVRYYLWEMDQGSTVIDNTSSNSGTGSGPATGSITVTGDPTYIVAVVNADNGFPLGSAQPLPAHWNNLFPTMRNDVSFACYRVVTKPGTYTFSLPIFGGVGIAWQVGMIALKASQPVPYPKALGNIVDKDSLDLLRAQCQAAGLIGSLNMNAQKQAGDWLKDFYICADAAPVWSGFVLKSIPRSEVSAVGNGRVYTSPTSTGPVATLTESDLIGDTSGPLVKVSRKSQVDSYNILQAQFFDRNSDYNPSTASEPLNGAIALFGPRKQDPLDLPEIQDPSVARMVLSIEARRYSELRNVYSFTARAAWCALEAMDLILINDSKIGLTNFPVRLTKVVENDQYELECEAEPFVYGVNSPVTLPVTVNAPYTPGDGGDPGSVNTPIIFEAVPRLSGQGNQAQIWLVISAASPNYGGCSVLISTDGGSSYTAVGAIQGSAVTGITVGDWPLANDPDTTNDLSVDLTESLGTLDTYSAADRDNFVYPCYVAVGTTCIPYELMTYDIATLTASYKYTLPATGGGTNELRRGVFGAPGPTVGVGVDHPGGSRFAFLNPLGFGIFKLNMDPNWIGKTLYFKFLAVNQLGENLQDQSAATAYSYTPNGCPAQTQNPNVNSYSVSSLLTQPTATTIHMSGPGGGSDPVVVNFPSNSATYHARDLTISSPTAPTLYYVTIYDTAQFGDIESPQPTAYADTTTTHWNSPGYIRVGTIIAIPGGGGTTTGGGGSGAIPAVNAPVIINFPCNSGVTGTDVTPDLAALRSGQISKWKAVVKASDGTTDLTFTVKQNGTGILTHTITHGTAAHTVVTGTFSPILTVAENDVFTFDISSGTATWQFTVELT